MGQVLQADSINDPVVQSITSVQLPGDNVITIGGQQYILTNKVMNAATTGLGGLDTGSLANNSTYNLFAVQFGVSGLVGSLLDAPAGFAAYTRVGSFGTDGTAQITSASPISVAVTSSDLNPIGMMVQSMLTEVQFQVANGPGWILADGRSVVGSEYEAVTGDSTVPDARGVLLRGKNNGRSPSTGNQAGDLALGVFQNDAYQGHYHGNGNTNLKAANSGSGNGDMLAVGSIWGVQSAAVRNNLTDNVNGTPRITNETRARNVTVNNFIKINSI